MKHVESLKEYCADVRAVPLGGAAARLRSVLALAGETPLSVAYYSSKAMRSHVRSILESVPIDAALIFSSSMAQFVLEAKGIRKVMDFVDVDSEKWLQYSSRFGFPKANLYRLEGRRLARYEERVARSVDLSVFVTEEEKNLFGERLPGARLQAVHNGVDLEYFRAGERPHADNGAPPKLVFVGAMDYFPNVEAVQYFVSEILPLIRREVPEVEFEVVGRNPSSAIHDLGKRDPKIHVRGTVPDVRPFLASATLSVAPLRIARGVQNKVLEAMGVPVVASQEAFEGILAIPGRDLVVATRPEEFAAETVRLIRDPIARERLGRSGKALIEGRYGWEASIASLERAIASL
jgi:sugar transferase (PEP-CTERM/EpsH1 system associated)